MFSGKSTYILQKIERAVYGKLRVCLIKPLKDTRKYFSHSGNQPDGKIKEFMNKGLLDYYEISEFTDDIVNQIKDKYDTILIDEFFMIHNCKKLATYLFKYGQNVYFAGLISTSENELFEEAKDILPYCDDIVKLSGVCMECGSQLGNYSLYKGIKDKELVIGDEDKYECVCKNCYFKLKK